MRSGTPSCQHAAVIDTRAPSIRRFEEQDRDAVVALSLRAWEPVFASLENVLGPSGVYEQLHPDWRASQASVVEAACDAEAVHTWVAEIDTSVVGFVAVQLDSPDSGVGQVYLLAVDPAQQRSGVGAALTSFALQWIRDQGMTVAWVETGGDPGHAPARRTYERAGFTALPVTRYFQKL